MKPEHSQVMLRSKGHKTEHRILAPNSNTNLEMQKEKTHTAGEDWNEQKH